MAEDQKQLPEDAPKHNDSSAAHFPEDSHAPQPAKNYKPETAPMEVHKHPHHVTHSKKWSEYLLEFFMIFFAVTAGFFAENIRENLSEHSKEKEYIHSLLLDLKSDTLMISRTIASNHRYCNDDSALLGLLQLPVKDPQTLKTIYSLYPQTEKFIVEINDPKTFEQLKNTGDIRLIKKEAVLDSMSRYYQKVNRMVIYRDEIQSQLQTTYNLSNKIFDNYSFDNNPGSPPGLITNDPILIKEYTNKLYHLTRDLKKYDRFLEVLQNSTKNFIEVIKTYYHIEKE